MRFLNKCGCKSIREVFVFEEILCVLFVYACACLYMCVLISEYGCVFICAYVYAYLRACECLRSNECAFVCVCVFTWVFARLKTSGKYFYALLYQRYKIITCNLQNSKFPFYISWILSV